MPFVHRHIIILFGIYDYGLALHRQYLSHILAIILFGGGVHVSMVPF